MKALELYIKFIESSIADPYDSAENKRDFDNWKEVHEALSPREMNDVAKQYMEYVSERVRGGKVKLPLFPLGQIVATPGALDLLERAEMVASRFLKMHATGDWGDLDEHDKKMNETAVAGSGRIMSAYRIYYDDEHYNLDGESVQGDGLRHYERLWIVTESDRSVTTLLLPEEY